MKYIFLAGCLVSVFQLKAQFHNLTMPKASPEASVSQQIGVTFVEINYDSPSTKGRDIWNDPQVIPQKGEPIAWRAGANENTTISFDTDVFVEGEPLKAGSYGFHIVPDSHSHTLLFVQPDNLWGSYYLNQEDDVVLRVKVKDSTAAFSEHLQYAVISRGRSSAVFALSWGDRIIPFEVSVDLENTVVEKFRYELNGENTYRWEAWNDAASWCLQNNTNLEEALSWVNRSIDGGYGGFASHKSFQNLSTKVELLDALNHNEELSVTLDEVLMLEFSADEGHQMASTLFRIKRDHEALILMKKGLKKYENDWVMWLFSGVANYYLKENKQSEKALKACEKHCPDWFKSRLATIQKEMKGNTYTYPNRKS